MKTTFLRVMAALLPLILVYSCTNPDLDELRRRLDDHESRLAKVEQTTTVANQEIAALRELLAAQAKQKSVTDYRPLDDGTGYLLTFSDGSSLKLLHGKNGTSSEIGVKLDEEDQTYYWTLNGTWMYDPQGNKIKAQGVDGQSGVTPLLRVSSAGYWEYSLDGKSWHLIQTRDGAPVKATGSGADSGLDIQETATHIIIYFKGQRFMVPKSGTGGGTTPTPEVKITLSAETKALTVGESFTLTATLEPSSLNPAGITWTSSHPEIAKVEQGVVTALSAGDAIITATHSGVSATCMVSVTAPKTNLTFELKVHDLHAVTALFDIIPSDQEATYYTSIVDTKHFNENLGGSTDNLFEHDKKWFGSSAADWITALNKFLVKGTKKNQPPKEVGATYLSPDTEYLFYAYGLNNKGEVTSAVTTITFKTPPSQKKDLTFEINIEDILTNGIIATIKPSKKDLQYIVAIVRDRYGKFYFQTEERKVNGAWKLVNDEAIRVKGDYIISPDSPDSSKYPKMLPGFQYWIIIFGYDEDGITSEVIYHPFTTKKRS